MPANVEAVKAMSWDDLQALFAAIYADGERRALRSALAEAA
jgi:hypothetical protein